MSRALTRFFRLSFRFILSINSVLYRERIQKKDFIFDKSEKKTFFFYFRCEETLRFPIVRWRQREVSEYEKKKFVTNQKKNESKEKKKKKDLKCE